MGACVVRNPGSSSAGLQVHFVAHLVQASLGNALCLPTSQNLDIRDEALEDDEGWPVPKEVSKVFGADIDDDRQHAETAAADTIEPSSGTSDSSSDSSVANEEDLNQKFAKPANLDYEGPLYQHKKSRALHKPHKHEGQLLCGRRIGVAYNFLAQGASFKWARCSHCFKGEVVTDIHGLVDT